jgi:Histidine kinase-, DNA gyrase B-, and HSP90-like ATPase
MYCPPKGHILESIAAQKLSWKHVFGEWIDNALDASATTINIVVDGKSYISVNDNGHGCSNPLVMAIPGDRMAKRSTKLGRYGIGGKDSGLWVGGVDSLYSIRTVHDRSVGSLQVNWRLYSDKWDIPDPAFCSAELGELGTRITVSPVRKKFPEGQALTQLLSDLGYTYSPALKKGAQISFQIGHKKAPALLVRWHLPPHAGGRDGGYSH